MSELRRKALGSGKTVSRKAQSRQSSAASSRANSQLNSRANSRVASRANTDDEGDLSDETNFSLGSADLSTFDELEEPGGAWQEELGDKILQITERKKSGFADREDAFAAYVRILSAKYAKEEIYHREADIIDSCLRSIKAGRTEKESLLAIKALALTMLTDPSDNVFDKVAPVLKLVISDHESPLVKSAVMRVLSTATFYGGASVYETEEMMAFFMDIVQSDGHNIGAGDDGGVVTAALEEWGFLCTQLDDVEEITMEAMEPLVDQLDSGDVSVQVAAGENIALLYEKSFTEAEEDEVDDPHEKKFIQRYQPYPRIDQLKDTLAALSSGSKKYLSKRNKKTQKTAFVDILHSVENPLKGPRYSEALDKDNNVRGSRMTVRVHKSGILRVDRWWKLQRVQHLRRILGGGFLTHWVDNPIVFESLELFVEQF